MMHGRKNIKLQTTNHSTHTYILLAALILPKCSVDSAFATNVSYSVGHLTSIL